VSATDIAADVPARIVAAFRALEFANVVADEHGHGPGACDGDDCDHPAHLLARLAADAAALNVGLALELPGAGYNALRYQLARAGLSDVEIWNLFGVFANWTERAR
jgi:hypothetical protein